MKKKLAILTMIFILSYPLYGVVRNNYSLDVSPLIKKDKMFSFGLAGIFSEYNAWFNNDVLEFYHSDNTNLSLRNINLNLMPYVEFRPIKNFLEIGVSASFTYKRNDSRNELTSLTETNSNFGFDSIHGFLKVNPINWYLSLGFRFDVDYSFYKYLLYTERESTPIDFTTTIMFSIVPKKIPINLHVNYIIHTDKRLSQLGELVGALEFITSPIIDLFIGTTFVFPYFAEDYNYYLEPFAKFNIKVGSFLHITSTYRKIAWGNNFSPNSSTVQVAIEYMF